MHFRSLWIRAAATSIHVNNMSSWFEELQREHLKASHMKRARCNHSEVIWTEFEVGWYSPYFIKLNYKLIVLVCNSTFLITFSWFMSVIKGSTWVLMYCTYASRHKMYLPSFLQSNLQSVFSAKPKFCLTSEPKFDWAFENNKNKRLGNL